MSSESSDESVSVERVVSQISRRIAEGKTNRSDLFALTGQLMEIAQTERLVGHQKKAIVLEAFQRITDDTPEAQTFVTEIMPYLIDILKTAARGGLHLAVQTRCCGLLD